MRNKIAAALALLLVVTGCQKKKPVPTGRLQQPAGEFSFVTPDHWARTKLAGIDFIIVSTHPDFGTRPNIFIDSVQAPGQAESVAKQTIETNRKNHPSYAVIRQSPFATKSGLAGFRIAARRENKDKLPLALFHYVIQDTDRTLVITCTCAEPVKQKYAPLFDSAMESLASEHITRTPPPITPPTPTSPIAKATRNQIGKTIHYDPAYVGLAYPGGDVPIDRGVCTDVVIRALRDALDMDLQKLVHEDMNRAFSQYPKNWGLKRTDRNIDHRRVPNLRTYFKRSGYSLDVSKKAEDYLPGDIVTCTVGGRPHIMVVSDKKTSRGIPLVIHNMGAGTKEENRLFDFPTTGHYRIKQRSR